jgi:hypothetical protein
VAADTPFSLGEKVARVARRMRASLKEKRFARTLTPAPLPSLDKPGMRREGQALVRALIARRAGVRVSGRKLDGDGGRRPASHGHGDKKKQQIVHSPQPAVPLRRCAGQKRLPADDVNAELWRPQFRCAVSAVTLTLAYHRASNGYRRID